MAQQPVEGVARSGEWIDDQGRGAGWRPCADRRGGRSDNRSGGRGGLRRDNRSDVPADRISQWVARAFNRGPAEQANALRVPVGGSHAVDGDVVSIAVAVAAVALHLPQLENRVALCTQQQ